MDKNKFLFSIVIPTFNREADLDRCLTSLAGQTFKNFEVIVCDNGSSDNTKGVAMDYLGKINLNYIFLPVNSGGPAAPRNLGIQAALGDWICFLDSDDWYTESRLERIAALNLAELDFLHHDLDIIKVGENPKRMSSRQLDKLDPYYDLLYNLNPIFTSSTCVRRDILLSSDGFSEDKEISGLEDFDLWLRLAKKGISFKHIPEVLGYYAVGDSNFTFYDERQVNRYKALYTFYIDLEKNTKNRKKVIAALKYRIALIYITGGKFFEANMLLVYSLVNGSNSLRRKTIFRFLVSIAYFFKSLFKINL
ncbi:glycosyltransferase [Flavobacterium sp. DG1-102-2]|nr:glycosyltransferase [Flavobacterium sp. DG1-102-2]